MTTFNTATALLNKRCDYIEEKLSHHSELVGKAPEGKHYRHFALQGLMSLAYYAPTTTALYDPSKNAKNSNVCTISDMHLSELAVFETEEKLVDQPVSLQDLRTYGFDLSDYPSLGVMYSKFRGSGLFTSISEAYRSTYGWPYGHDLTSMYTTHYKGRELIPADTEASWDVQAENLLYQVRSFPLKDLLGEQHIIADDGRAGALSLRRAGFPVAQFQANTHGRNIVPSTVPTSSDVNPVALDDLSTATVTRHCPSIVLVTIECPDEVDSLISGDESGSVKLTYYFKHIAVPHWVGHSNGFNQSGLEAALEGQPFETSHLYDPSKVTHYADHLTSAFIHGRRDDPARNYGDLVIYTPSDSSLESTKPLQLSDARSFEQELSPLEHLDLSGKVLTASGHIDARSNGFNILNVFQNNPSQWGRNRGNTIEFSFKTRDLHSVRGLRMVGLSDRDSDKEYMGSEVRIYTKPADDPTGLTDTAWVFHSSASVNTDLYVMDVLLESATPATNLFKVVLTRSAHRYYIKIQYLSFLVAMADEQ